MIHVRVALVCRDPLNFVVQIRTLKCSLLTVYLLYSTKHCFLRLERPLYEVERKQSTSFPNIMSLPLPEGVLFQTFCITSDA